MTLPAPTVSFQVARSAGRAPYASLRMRTCTHTAIHTHTHTRRHSTRHALQTSTHTCVHARTHPSTRPSIHSAALRDKTQTTKHTTADAAGWLAPPAAGLMRLSVAELQQAACPFEWHNRLPKRKRHISHVGEEPLSSDAPAHLRHTTNCTTTRMPL